MHKPEEDSTGASSDEWEEEYTIEEFTLLLPETKKRKTKTVGEKPPKIKDGGGNRPKPTVMSTLCCCSRTSAISECMKSTNDECVIL